MGFLPQIKLLDIFMFWEQEGYILDSHLMQTLSLSKLSAMACLGSVPAATAIPLSGQWLT